MKSLLTIETKQQKKSSERNKQLINREKLKQTEREKKHILNRIKKKGSNNKERERENGEDIPSVSADEEQVHVFVYPLPSASSRS